MFFSVLFYCIRRGGKGFTEVRFVLQFGTFCFEPLEHFVLRIIDQHGVRLYGSGDKSGQRHILSGIDTAERLVTRDEAVFRSQSRSRFHIFSQHDVPPRGICRPRLGWSHALSLQQVNAGGQGRNHAVRGGIETAVAVIQACHAELSSQVGSGARFASLSCPARAWQRGRRPVPHRALLPVSRCLLPVDPASRVPCLHNG